MHTAQKKRENVAIKDQKQSALLPYHSDYGKDGRYWGRGRREVITAKICSFWENKEEKRK